MATRTKKPLSDAAQAAKEVKAHLSKAFPNVLFSCRSESFSGGDAVRIEWNFGPTKEQVKTISDRYQDTYYNAQEDLQEYRDKVHEVQPDGSIRKLPTASFVSESRRIYYSKENAYLSEPELELAKMLCALLKVEFVNPYTQLFSKDYNIADQCVNFAARLIYKTSFPSDKIKITGVKEREGVTSWASSDPHKAYEILFDNLGGNKQEGSAPRSHIWEETVPEADIDSIKLHMIAYNDRSFVVYGERTKELAETLRKMGGSFNARLKHPKTEGRLMGWIFSNKHAEKIIDKFFKNIL